MSAIRLGLIGDNIARSQSPRLHVLAGRLSGLDVTYERLIPSDLGADFDAVFARCETEGFRGINITYPYKETVIGRLTVADPAIRAIGACNTVLFDDAARPSGHNTDYSGFIAAFRRSFSGAAPGRVAMAGAGGVGKAVAFALAGLGATVLAVYDRDAAKVAGLAEALERSESSMTVETAPSIEAASESADGLVNCSPLGMVGHPGTAIPKALMAGARWAFDAVYTPVETAFLTDAREAGLDVMSGYELFFHQGIDAFRLFTGADVDETALRQALLAPQEGERSALAG